MQVQCSKCGGDTDTGFRCVKCGHSMQPHNGGTPVVNQGDLAGNRQRCSTTANPLKTAGNTEGAPREKRIPPKRSNMIAVKKLRKNVIKYCTHCDGRALYVLYFTNPIIVQQGSNGALCKQCIGQLKAAVVKAISPNKRIKQESADCNHIYKSATDAAEALKPSHNSVTDVQRLNASMHNARDVMAELDIFEERYCVKHPGKSLSYGQRDMWRRGWLCGNSATPPVT